MSPRRKKHREKSYSHQKLIEMGYSLPQDMKPQKKKCKDCITSSIIGSNSRMYFKIMKMTKSEKKIFTDSDKRRKAGKEISYSFEPMDLIMKLSIDVKKDRRGNVRVNIKQAKKGYCHRWDCPKKAKKDYSLCPKHLKLNKLRRKK